MVWMRRQQFWTRGLGSIHWFARYVCVWSEALFGASELRAPSGRLYSAAVQYAECEKQLCFKLHVDLHLENEFDLFHLCKK